MPCNGELLRPKTLPLYPADHTDDNKREVSLASLQERGQGEWDGFLAMKEELPHHMTPTLSSCSCREERRKMGSLLLCLIPLGKGEHGFSCNVCPSRFLRRLSIEEGLLHHSTPIPLLTLLESKAPRSQRAQEWGGRPRESRQTLLHSLFDW